MISDAHPTRLQECSNLGRPLFGQFCGNLSADVRDFGRRHELLESGKAISFWEDWFSLRSNSTDHMRFDQEVTQWLEVIRNAAVYAKSSSQEIVPHPEGVATSESAAHQRVAFHPPKPD